MPRPISAIIATTLLVLAGAHAQQAEPPATSPDTSLPVVDEAMVRFVHVSPNAGAVEVALAATDAGAAERHVVELDYLETTEYRTVREGSFDITATSAHGGEPIVLAEQVQTVPGGSYTVALIGLALDEGEAGEADDGFVAWLQGIFTPDRPELALRAVVLDDVGAAGVGPGGEAVRVVHAAPGTDTLEVVHVRDDTAEVLASVSYLDVTGFIDVVPEAGTLELRAEGADTTIADIDGVDPAPGRIHTIFLVGTPIEDVPLGSLAVSAEWATAGPTVPGGPGLGTTGFMTTEELTTIRELAFELGVRIELAEQRLAELGDDADRDALAEARRELEDATRLLEQLHLVLDGAEQRVP
jgi:hypothetical protein